MHFMFDIETLSTRPDAAILSIGCVAFNEDGPHHSFSVNCDPESQRKDVFHVDAQTVRWWANQTDIVRLAVEHSRTDLMTALVELSAWIEHHETDKNFRIVWGNGAAFDIAILEHAYGVSLLNMPWNFWNVQCYRTLKNLHRDVKYVPHGTKHVALDDAVGQMYHLRAIMKKHYDKSLRARIRRLFNG